MNLEYVEDDVLRQNIFTAVRSCLPRDAMDGDRWNVEKVGEEEFGDRVQQQFIVNDKNTGNRYKVFRNKREGNKNVSNWVVKRCG